MNDTAQRPIQPVEQPILSSPYEEPPEHWWYEEDGTAKKNPGRRPAGYYYKTDRTGGAQARLFAEENRDDLPLVNALRDDVKRWRASGYRGAEPVTRELLRHWGNPKRTPRLFFCQIEAVETIIYLAEVRLPGRSSRTGFRNFALTDDDLKRLMRGEKPTGFVLTRPDFYPMLADQPLDPSLQPLVRLGCKMATGAGKTVAMAMLVAWAFCNRGENPASTHFPNGVLVCCPNLIVKERLQVLRPELAGNYYDLFDIVPAKYREHLNKGDVLVENWHQLAPESEHKEGDRSYAVVNKGDETPETLARRVLGDLFDRMPIMVLNDEGHHCWRPAPEAVEQARGRANANGLTAEEKKQIEEEAKEARVWLDGLDRINNALGPDRRGISFCVDMSATPFYIQGSGHPEGWPFPWIVSDFGLVDAIESGIVKIPRLPVAQEGGPGGTDDAGRPDPKYFRLWRNIVDNLKAGEKYQSGKPKPDIAYREAEGALQQIAAQWVQRFKQIEEARPGQEPIPPVLIVVCDNTEIAEVFYRKISGETQVEDVTQEDVEAVESGDEDSEAEEAIRARRGKTKKRIRYGNGVVFPEYFANTPGRKHTIRIDSKLLAEAELGGADKTRQVAAEELRRVVSTVGKPGQPGEHVRCVVSVSMLTEGWDASNVTHVLGVRAFGSQLLCEQVVGRGLRRMSYEPDPQTGRLVEEDVDVYGIPFSVIPFKGRKTTAPAPEDKPVHKVFALPGRGPTMEIRFPNVENYTFALRKNVITCDVGQIEWLDVVLEPTKTFLHPAAGYYDQATAAMRPFEFVEQNREEYYRSTHLQTILFQITQRVIDELLAGGTGTSDRRQRVFNLQSRHQLFPQVFAVVREFAQRRVRYHNVDERELGLEKYMRLAVERVRNAIMPDELRGEAPLLPVLNRYRRATSTAGVDFVTTRPVVPTVKSHINYVVLDSGWEAKAAKVLEDLSVVDCYARNEHLGLEIPYEFLETMHWYIPDFVVRLTNGLQVLLEIKGYEIHNQEQLNAKHSGAKRWVAAVNNQGDFGQWEFLLCRDLEKLPGALKSLAAGGSARAAAS